MAVQGGGCHKGSGALTNVAVKCFQRVCVHLPRPKSGKALRQAFVGQNMLLVMHISCVVTRAVLVVIVVDGGFAMQVEISKSYGAAEWREDLKRFVRIAGGDNKPAVFLFSDSQIKVESFVEDINNLLNSGEVRSE